MEFKFVELIKPGTNIDFLKIRKPAVILSLIANIIVLALAFYPGLNYGVDFAGGTEIEVKFDKTVDVAQLRKKVEQLGFGEPQVQAYGTASDNAYLIRV